MIRHEKNPLQAEKVRARSQSGREDATCDWEHRAHDY